MKKLSYVLALTLLLAACGSDSESDKPEATAAPESTTVESNTSTNEEDAKSKEEDTSKKEANQTKDSTNSASVDTQNKSIETTTNLNEVKQTQDSATTIDTSIFDLAKEVNVTDARDITQHITLQIILKDAVKQGNGVQGVLTQTYDFLQQDDIAGANTITIFVNSGQLKIFQITIDTSKFKTNDEISMIKLVLDAAEIEKMTDEVKTYGEALKLW